ncbi:hypothetical protein ACFXHA_44275 [Nocardia sp. NPDC059240]|uniref:hypothetical protein n=1 Tax=Nocardia sp. NPDC059240 TaxID=3346786 RepID=UPI0036BB6CC3
MGKSGSCDRSDLCAEFSGTANTEFTRTYSALTRRSLAGSDDSIAVVDLSPLTTGHVLVCPRLHYFNAAQAIADPACGFGVFLEGFLRKYVEVFGEFTILEHGSTRVMPTACISHAHLHVLPMALEPIIRRMYRDGLSLNMLDGWGEVSDLVLDESPYYLAADSSRFFVAQPLQRMAGQYLRVVAGECISIPAEECDWAVVIRREIFHRTVQLWAAHPANEGVML